MPYRDRARALLREPFFHFLLAGVAIFAFFVIRGVEVDPASRSIVIDRSQVEQLGTQFAQTYRRAPTAGEMDGLIRDYVEEEIYYREALRLGLDADDPVIRRRLSQKMKYLARSAIENEQPDDATLQRLLDAAPARYAPGARFSFDQIYLADDHAPTSGARVSALLARLPATPDWRGLGDTLSVPASMEKADRRDIARQFGEDFADRLTTLIEQPLVVWRGPIASGYGLHLVRVREVASPGKPKLEEVRQAVENDWRAQTVAAREAEAYRMLRDGYTIKVARP